MVGRVGTAFGEAGINILSAAVGHRGRLRRPRGRDGVTTDAAVPSGVLDRIVASDGFVDGRTVALQ
jgi:D-3-phosphoglycerate dehydrogenase